MLYRENAVYFAILLRLFRLTPRLLSYRYLCIKFAEVTKRQRQGSMMKKNDDEEKESRTLYTRAQAADWLGISLRTLDGLSLRGELTTRKLGGGSVFHIADLEAFADSLPVMQTKT